MKSKRIRNIIIASAMAVLFLVGGVFAYLTDKDDATNIFTMGDVTIDLDEPEYPGNDSDEVTDIWAGKVITKDPTIENLGDNEAYVYLQISVPKAEVITTDDNGNLLNNGEPKMQQLFNYVVNDGWTLLKSNTVGTNVNHYLYAYTSKLAPGEKTPALFDEVVFVNVIEDQISTDTVFELPIKAYAIQANYGDGTAADAHTYAEAWEFYANQNNITLFD